MHDFTWRLNNPSSFLFAALVAVAVAGCGVNDNAKKGDTGTPQLSFATDVAPIIKSNCSDDGCHGKTGAQGVVYEDNEANYLASQNAPISTSKRLAKAFDDPDYMPRGKTLTAADKLKLLDFLTQ